MYKKLPLLLLVSCSSCTHLPIEGSAQSQTLTKPPSLNAVMQANAVEINNDWNGYSDITPILRHYKLRRQQQQFVGNAYVAVGGYGAAGIHQQQTTKIAIPAAIGTKFLTTLAKTPLQVGSYQPKLDRHDDYPSIKIQLQIDRQQVTFSSQSQANNYIPWKITISQDNRTKEYISNSPLPAQALQVINPYVDRSGIDQIIQRRRQKKAPAIPRTKHRLTVGRSQT
jgi:hypothetical protein